MFRRKIEVFDHRHPEVNVTRTYTELGARFYIWARSLTGKQQIRYWLDYAREGEGW